MQQHDTYYDLLGVTPDATDSDIRRAFRTLAKHHHPDAADPNERQSFEARFRDISVAYETLKDPLKRGAYDDELAAANELVPYSKTRRKSRAFVIGLASGVAVTLLLILGKFAFDRNADGTTSKTQDQLAGNRAASPSKYQKSLDQESFSVNSLEAAEPPASASDERLRENAGHENAGSTVEKSATVNDDVNAIRELPEQTTATVAIEQNSSPADMEVAKSAPEVTTASVTPAPTPATARVVNRDAQTASNADYESDAMLSPNANFAPRQTFFTASVLNLETFIAKSEAKNNARSESATASKRLASLIASEKNIAELKETASIARRAETRAMIDNRLADLKATNYAADRQAVATPSLPAKLAKQNNEPLGNAPADKTANLERPRSDPDDGPQPGRLRDADPIESFVDCRGCPTMLVVPTTQNKDARPKALAVSRSEVSIKNWRACMMAGGCGPGRLHWLMARPDLPATGVSWNDAKTYVSWLSAVSGETYRLLTEAEWDYMARAGTDVPMRTIHEAHMVRPYRQNLAFDLMSYRERTTPANDSQKNRWGVVFARHRGMEWVEDCWQKPSDRNKQVSYVSETRTECPYRVIRGMTTESASNGAQISERARELAELRVPTIGFRVARDVSLVTPKLSGDHRDASR